MSPESVLIYFFLPQQTLPVLTYLEHSCCPFSGFFPHSIFFIRSFRSLQMIGDRHSGADHGMIGDRSDADPMIVDSTTCKTLLWCVTRQLLQQWHPYLVDRSTRGIFVLWCCRRSCDEVKGHLRSYIQEYVQDFSTLKFTCKTLFWRITSHKLLGLQPNLGHRCTRGTLIFWCRRRSHVKVKGHLRSYVKVYMQDSLMMHNFPQVAWITT